MLVQDPFGNYVVQYVLDLGEADFIEDISRRFFGHVCDLSMQKFSSNVVEKASCTAIIGYLFLTDRYSAS